MKVFLSYTKADHDLAATIATVLREDGFDPWLDSEQVLPGDNWPAALADALESSDAMLLLITSDWLGSKQAQYELEFAISNPHYRKRLFPVVVANADKSGHEFPWFLQKLQVFHLSGPSASPEELHQLSDRLKQAA